jgi:hypothetical protein
MAVNARRPRSGEDREGNRDERQQKQPGSSELEVATSYIIF